jgi:hypothetical protein
MPYVTAAITAGMGNRFFQVAAMLGYAETHGHTPVFVSAFIGENPWTPGPYDITQYFPDIPLVKEEISWTVLKEAEGAGFTYSPLPFCEGHVKLQGIFQAHPYFPSSPIPVPPLLRPSATSPSTFFFHVRRGDYLIAVCAHHYVPLETYWERCLATLSRDDLQILVCSDDIQWCKETLPILYSHHIKPHQWRFSEAANETEALKEMIACESGGICANSTFSWFPAYWIQNKEKRIFMPGTWGRPPMPVARDIWPPWAIRVPT